MHFLQHRNNYKWIFIAITSKNSISVRTVSDLTYCPKNNLNLRITKLSLSHLEWIVKDILVKGISSLGIWIKCVEDPDPAILWQKSKQQILKFIKPMGFQDFLLVTEKMLQHVPEQLKTQNNTQILMLYSLSCR